MFEIIFYISILTIALFAIALEIYKWRIDRKLTNFVSGTNYPIIGFPAQFIGKNNLDISQIMNKVFMDQPDSVTAGKAWVGYQLIIALSDPEDLKTVLMSDDCLDKPYMYQHLDANNSILSSAKEQWKYDRRHLGSTLGIKMVAKCVPMFNEKIKKCMGIISNTVGDVDFHRIIWKCLIDMHFVATFGSDCDIQTPIGDDLYDNLMTVMVHYQSRLFKPWLRWDIFYKMTNAYRLKQKAYLKMFNFINKVAVVKSHDVRSRIVNSQNCANSGNGIDIDNPADLNLLEKCFVMLLKNQMTEETLNDHAYIVTAAAVDSTTSALYSILLLLAIHPKYQEKVVAELRGIFDSADSPVTLEDCSRMEYTEMVIKESMRLLPPTPLIGRQSTAELSLRSGTVPKGTMIVLNMDKIHRQERNWGPRSNEFYPDHFSAENLAEKHPYTFIGFSAGPRNCMGVKYALIVLKVMLSHFLRNFKLSSDLKVEDIKTELSIVLKIKNKNPFRCEPRTFK